MLGILGNKGECYGDQTMTPSREKTAKFTGNYRAKRQKGRKKKRLEEEVEQVAAASSGGIK